MRAALSASGCPMGLPLSAAVGRFSSSSGSALAIWIIHQCHARAIGLRSLSVHPAESHPVLHRGRPGSDHHDEPETQEAKDRLRSLNDYRVNLKAELEIRHLHEKLDHLITRQWERLAEIQELQIELLQERR